MPEPPYEDNSLLGPKYKGRVKLELAMTREEYSSLIRACNSAGFDLAAHFVTVKFTYFKERSQQ